MRLAAAGVVLALATAPAAAEVVVRVSGGHVDLTATAAPLADVLDRLARQTGMKVVYEGPAPRQLVTVSLHGRTPAETVLAVFEGLGVNYALVADPTGTSVQTLVVAGSATATASSSPSAAAGRPAPRPNPRRPFGPPPGSSPETVEPAFDEGDDEAELDEADFAGLPPGAEAGAPAGAGAPLDPAAANVPAHIPNVAPPGAGVVPTQPSSPASAAPFSASPFTPQPQPFPPVPPGAPTGTQPAEEATPLDPTSAVGVGRGYGRVVVPGRVGGKAPPGRGIAGPTCRPTIRGWPGRNTHSL